MTEPNTSHIHNDAMLSKASEMNISLRQNNVFSPVVIIIESQMTTIKFVGKNTLIWHTFLTSFI